MTHHGGRHCTFFTVKKHDLAITSWNRICTASCTDAKLRVHVPITPVTISHPTYMPLCNGTSSSSLFNTQRVQFYYLQMHYHYRIQTSINMLINTSSNSTSLFRPHTGKGVKVKIWTLAIVPLTSVRLVTSSALQSRKWQLIGMSQWCRSALCGHPLPALTDNWTHSAASRHTIAPISHTRPSPRSRSYYSFPVLLRVGG